MMLFEESAPSNIALIKYMGKTEAAKNLPANPSLSWTTPDLRSFVQLELISNGTEDRWESHPGYYLELAPAGREKFLSFFQKLKAQFHLESSFFVVRSGNNFPSDCGIASSASSFAALTLCSASAAKGLSTLERVSLEELSRLSRQGSGSSCRSFFDGWVQWESEGAEPISSSLKDLLHGVVVVSGEKKKVSSSQAHLNVQSSALFHGRIERASERFRSLKSELGSESPNWQRIYELSWSEFWDMHALFETSHPSFGYMTPGSLSVLSLVRDHWEAHGDGPVATMDAGANVHLLWRSEQIREAQEFHSQLRKNHQQVISFEESHV